MSSNSAIDSLRTTRDLHSERENQRGRGRGSYINYYGDLGFSTTDTAHSNWQKQEDLYQKQKAEDLAIIKKNKDLIAQAENEYNNYNYQAPDVNAAVEDSYWKQKDLVPVRVVGLTKNPSFSNQESDAASAEGWDNEHKEVKKVDWKQGKWGTILPGDYYKVEGTYYLPQSSIDTSKFQGFRYFTGYDGSLLVNNVSTQGGKSIGKQLHDSFRNAQDDYASKYKEAASQNIRGQVSQQQAAFNKSKQSALNDITEAKAQAQAAEERVSANDQLRVDQLNTLRNNYQKRLDTLRDVFNGTNGTAST